MTTVTPVATTEMGAAPPLVLLRNINKGFNGVRVLEGVDFELRAGEVHALMGGNGAGKSTLMKILQGVYQPDSGEILVNGQPVHLNSPSEAERHGIAMIFQEFSLVPTLTAAQNIFLNREPRGAFGAISDREAVRRSRDIFREMGVNIDPGRTVQDLSTGEWQLTEIAKALSKNARVLIMDEPTAALSATEVTTLFGLVEGLKARGIAIVYITHRMEEVFQVADRVTVMRDGKAVLSEPTNSLRMEDVIENIVGRRMEGALEWKPRKVNRTGAPLLEVSNLSAPPAVRDVSFTVYPGEIVGLAGLMGSGRTELAETLFGVRRATGGTIRLGGREVSNRRPDQAIAHGFALVPEDRRVQGLVLDHTVYANLLLPQLKRFESRGVMQDRSGKDYARELIEQLRIKTDGPDKQTRLLSGGNQQKIVLAKWLGNDPQLLILDEPTAGVDIGSKAEIIALIRDLADLGKAVLLISSEFQELLAASDRVLLVQGGRVTGDLMRETITREEDLHHALQGGTPHDPVHTA
ncbi:sugar ABC transporter ATP-binding protein [Deinococcus aestuarii]|uniref:sugar ABC transporter ATP-binding protein n=1 Tax=Deinococcus aestuarii TaxID=2774531 RepID=UPI001C0CC8D8|nr:sugar ABC transporter ATP-binding protein [Deinococcus aestuarii]